MANVRVSANTDGVMWKLPSVDCIAIYKKICQEWCDRTRMTLDHDLIKKVIQKDVNNYLIVMTDGEIKSKGAWCKELNNLDYDLPIVNKAVVNYFTLGVCPEDTVNKCNTLRDFQKISKISGKYECAYYGFKKLSEKTLRVFASKNKTDKGVFKQKKAGATLEKLPSTPVTCFIDNSDMEGKRLPRKLDKQWYIDLAWNRIKNFMGV